MNEKQKKSVKKKKIVIIGADDVGIFPIIKENQDF